MLFGRQSLCNQAREFAELGMTLMAVEVRLTRFNQGSSAVRFQNASRNDYVSV
jgi:hypothetical protein